MVFQVYMLAVKAPGITLKEFKEYWDNQHLNLLKEIAGDAYPAVHKHWYPEKLIGINDHNLDGIGYLEFARKEDFLKLVAILDIPENKARINIDEGKFLDISKFQMYSVSD
ncbi:hypothetical protein V8C34DRAFT_299969 [Trichoderma compactum]